MSDAAIQKMHDFDWEVFKQERIYRLHTQDLGIGIFDEPSAEQEDKSALMKKFLESVSRWDDYTMASRYGWIEGIGDQRLVRVLKRLSISEKELLTKYLKKGYTREWINQRLQAIQVRKELTDEWDARGVQKGVEYAILTDEISRAWSGMSTRQYKNLKGLKKENLRDNMTTLELVLNMLAEATTTEISKQKAPSTFSENIAVAREGGEAAGIARKAVEERTGVPVITSKNAAQLNQVVTDLLEGAAADMSEMPEKK